MSVASTGTRNSLRRGDRQHAGAGAEIEDVARTLRTARQRVERQQAAAGGAVMTGAERCAGLDLDADAMTGHMRSIVCAVHDEAAGGDRLQPRRLSFTQSRAPIFWTVTPLASRSPHACAIIARSCVASGLLRK